MCCPFYMHFFRNRIEHLFVLWYNILVQSKRKWMQISDYSPLVHKGARRPGDVGYARTEVKRRGVMPMDTMEVLTLVLVIFAILAYLDNRYDHDSDKKK